MSALSKYKTYPEYKDSGVEWLGEIPSHWEIKPLKYIFKLNPSKSELNENSLNQICSFVPMEKLKLNTLELDDSKIIKDVYNGYTYFKDHDILIAKVTPCFENKNMAIAQDLKNGIGFGSTEIYALRPYKENNNHYIYYRLQDSVFSSLAISNMTGAGGLKRVPSEFLNSYQIAITNHEEQTKIAQFLDHETAKIDQLIEKQQTLIELLKEKRQAVISHAVTKGLDPHVKMKDSGVEWLDEVPEHWDILATKRFFKLVCEPAPNNNDYELLSVYTEIGVRPRKDLEQKGNKASTTDGYWIVKEHDLVVNKLLAWMGAIGYSAYNGVTSPAYDILRPSQNTNSEFYHYLFRTKQANAEFKRWSRGIMEMRLRLYFDELGNILMPVPTLKEQNSIVAHIKTYEYKTDLLIQKAEQQIELMKERRTALISAAVTGKIDVRDWQPEQ